jgi:Raf kinase inhibitor-like YbhB/YbcL family protein
VRAMWIRTISTATILLLAAIGLAAQAAGPQGQQAPAPQGPGFALTTTAFEDGSIIPAKYTQLVPSPVTPKLEWANVPAGTVSFVLIVHDPDGALQKKLEQYLHWMLFNIPGTARELPEGVAPTPQLADGTIQAKNGRGDVGYRGPGAGAAGPYHHYTFELYALDIKLDLGPDAIQSDVLKAIDGHILGKAVLVGRFHR